MSGLEELTSLEIDSVGIASFRGIASQRRLRIGRVTLLCGPNGLGKTTVFDAIDWALFGDCWRLNEHSGDVIRNLWARADPWVEVVTPQGLLRRDATAAQFNQVAYSPVQLAADAALFARPALAAAAIRRAAYLPQDVIRQVLNEDGSRAALLSAMSGVPNAARFARNVQNTLGDIDRRERSVRDGLDELVSRLAELSEQVKTAIDESVAIPEAVGVVREFLGAAQTDEADALEVRLRSRIEQLVEKRSAAEERSRRLEQVRANMTRALVQIANAEPMTATLESEERTSQEARRLADVEIERSLAQISESSRSLERMVDRATAVRSELDRVRRRRTSITQLRELNRRQAEARRRVTELHQLADASESKRRVLVDARESAADAMASAENALAEKNRLMKELSAVRAQEAGVQENVADVRARLFASERQLVEVQAAYGQLALRVATERERVGQYGENAERLAVLLVEIASFQDLRPGICPVCSHDHKSKENLARSIDETIKELKRHHDVARLVNEIHKQMDAERRRVDETNRIAEALRREVAGAELRLAELAAKTSRLALEDGKSDLQVLIENRRIAAKRLDEAANQLSAADKSMRELSRERDQCSVAVLEIEDSLRQVAEALGSTPKPDEDVILQADHERLLAEAEVLDREVESARASVRAAEDGLSKAQSAATNSHARAAESRARLERLRGEIRAWRNETALAQAAAEELGVQEPDLVVALNAALARSDAEIGEVAKALETGRELLATLVEALRVRNVSELRREVVAVEHMCQAAKDELAKLQRARGRLAEISRRVDVAVKHEATQARANCKSTMDMVMAILSPHRHLNELVMTESGDVWLRDEKLSAPVDPHAYSSTAQLNCVALSAFLGFAIGARVSKLRCVLLDEPVQNLDDVNLLSFLDLVRHVARTHQVVLSTASPQIAELFRHKFGLWAHAEEASVVIHEFQDFDRRTGPRISSRVARVRERKPGYDVVSSAV